jgi:SAM-dependent methyltransferase
MYVAPVTRHPFPGQEAFDGDDHLFERRDRRGRPRPHLPHPRLHTVADAREDTPRRQPAQCRDLHRRDRRVSGHRREDPDAHLEPFGDGERRCPQRDSRGVEAVLDHPQLVGAAVVETTRHLRHEPGGEGPIEAHPDRRSHRAYGTSMGLYSTRVLPRILDKAGGMKSVAPLRRRVCEGLSGDVVEIGFGSGLNIPFYPAAVTSVAAIEPADRGWKLADKRLMATSIPVERAGLDGQSLPFADDSYDAVLSTWTLCTIPDASAALREMRRVLKPGGSLHFIEHGLAPDEKVRRWQHRCEPMQKRLFGGCHLTRPIVDLLTDAGFTISELDVFYEKGSPKFVAADSLGVAISP